VRKGLKSVNIIACGKTWVDAPLDGNNWGITLLPIQRGGFSLVIDMNYYADGRWGEQQIKESEIVKKRCEEIEYVTPENYPLKDIMDFFETDYFSSTVDYAIALALYRQYKEINLYGVTLTAHEYANFKPGVDFWCGYAKGLGVKVIVHGESRVMRTMDDEMYGYGTKQKG
jgi:hypothetical protein